MKLIPVSLILISFLFTTCTLPPPSEISEKDYIEAWKKFYPSKALAQGMHDAIYNYEDRSYESIAEWLEVNQKLLGRLPDEGDPASSPERINARLLKVQIQKELHLWDQEMPQFLSSEMYANLIDRAFDQVLKAEFLTAMDKADLICQRMESIQALCMSGIKFLEEVTKEEVLKSVETLEKNKAFFEKELSEKLKKEGLTPACYDFENQTKLTASSIQRLIDYLRETLLTNDDPSNSILGRNEYARRLTQYLDMSTSPEELAELALQEIEQTRKLIGEVSLEYVKDTYSGSTDTDNLEEAIKIAFADMEKDAPSNGEEYLQFWQDLSASAVQFIEENNIATLPKYQTLRIMPAPESAGPSARVGWVDSAPPFDPNPVTTLYLPNIPDDFPEEEKKDFWSSFNKPFNRMIVIHELFPGHYMQIKISRETAHPIRLLFPYGPYFEGWATFTERVALDAGWEKDRPLTFLAHLRKRLENANRAYTSVQVHCNAWDQEKVMEFSTETSLLAPQFAKSLWGRLMRSPMQMTSYFYGGVQFTDLLKKEKDRLGEKFNLQNFMDTIMKIGPIPIEEFYTIFRKTIPN